MKRKTERVNTRVDESTRRRLDAQARRIECKWRNRPATSAAARRAVEGGLAALEAAEKLDR